jgi:hypothetical protein
MKILLLVFSLTFIFTSRAQSAKKLLFKAYHKKSTELLDEFFENWQAKIPPITDSELQSLNDTIRNTYEVYTQFIRWKNINFPSHKYVLIQNSIDVGFSHKIYFSSVEIDSIITYNLSLADSLDQIENQKYLRNKDGSFTYLIKELYGPDLDQLTKPTIIRTETNFRPVVKTTNGVVYLNTKYSELLDGFLNSKSNDNRKLFLDAYLNIQKSYLFRKWDFAPYSHASVTFDRNMEYAKVNFGVGEVVYMKRENDVWKFLSHELKFVNVNK